MRQRLFIVVAALVSTGLLSACSNIENGLNKTIPLPNAGQAAAIGVGVEVLKIKAERRMEMTCNPLNLLSDGKYCVSNYKPTDRQEVWCFKTLGGVDCYGEPDPYSLAGHQLPAAPRALADPRMPMTPPGRRPPPQVAVAPAGAEPAEEAAPPPIMPAVTPPQMTAPPPAPMPAEPAPAPVQ